MFKKLVLTWVFLQILARTADHKQLWELQNEAGVAVERGSVIYDCGKWCSVGT